VTNVAALRGGWAAWQRVGYPLEGARIPTPSAPIVAVEEMTLLGSADAPVTIEEFSDFQ
jgi:3-mercaptopyruvate sulfurtransferase SseA